MSDRRSVFERNKKDVCMAWCGMQAGVDGKDEGDTILEM